MGSTCLLLSRQKASAGETMLQILSWALSPVHMMSPCCLQDPILVSIDIGLRYDGALDTIGVACLDTRHLADGHREDFVSSKLFLLRRRSLPSNQKTLQYLFGIPEHLRPQAARESLLTIFSQPDPEYGRPRNIILIGHNIEKDNRYLSNTIGLDISSVPSIITTVDTQQLARRVFNFRHKNISLQRTLSALGIKPIQLHNSGNDAVYALKAALHLFCSYQEEAIEQKKCYVGSPYRKRDKLNDLLWQGRLDLLTHIARHCPEQLSVRDARNVGRPPRPDRVDNPDLFKSDAIADGEEEGAIIAIFGDDM